MYFSDVIGQLHVKNHLLNMCQGETLPHALLFNGPQGGGKLPLAISLAHYLLCESPTPEGACGSCKACQMLRAGTHPDLHFSFPVYKKKSTDHPVSDDYLAQWNTLLSTSVYFDVEDWLEIIKAENHQIVHYVNESESLQQKLAYKAKRGGSKIVILWLPERMMAETANKLLKLIEEPPTGTYFLLVSEQEEKVLGTILSRVQRVHVPPLEETEIKSALQKEGEVNEKLASSIAHVAQGNYTRALKILRSKDEESTFFAHFVLLMRKCYLRDIREMKKWADETSEYPREQQKRMLSYFLHTLRENFIYNFKQEELNYQTQEEQEFSARFAPFINERNIYSLMNEFSDALRDIEQNVNAKMVYFDLSLKVASFIKRAQ